MTLQTAELTRSSDAVVDTGTGTLEQTQTWEEGDTFVEQFVDAVVFGDADDFTHEIKSSSADDVTTVNGSIEDAAFDATFSMQDGVMSIETNLSGGDPEKAYSFKVADNLGQRGFTTATLQAGREPGSSSSTTTNISFTTDEDNNIVFDRNQSVERLINDEKTPTNRKE